MTNMTLTIPDDLKIIMENHPEVMWNEVVMQAIRDYAKRLEGKSTTKSKFRDESTVDSFWDINAEEGFIPRGQV